jgi:phage portal protein BeeE
MPKLWRSLLGRAAGTETRYRVGEDYLSDFSGISLPAFANYYGGSSGRDRDRESIENSFSAYVNGIYKADGIVFACMTARQLVFSEARFQFRQIRNGRPGDLFGTAALRQLENPWPNGTTGELLSRMIQDVDTAGNAYVVREDNRLRRRRPDWVQIILSAPPEEAVQSDVLGYAYWPGGIGRGKPKIYLLHEMCHWSPIPDPDAEYRGMSALTPVVREVAADMAATGHKLSFFNNGASLGPIFTLKETVTEEQFKAFVTASNAAIQGSDNAYKPLYMGGGADVTLGTASMQQIDYRAIVGAGETRIAAALRVHPVIVGLSEGMQGSSLNAGNYAAAKRNFVDGTIRPLWRSVAAALASIVAVPAGAELWFDARDIAYLREDAKDAADIQQIKASTINSFVTNGFTPESAVAAVDADDRTLLQHSGLVSVQLLPPGTGAGGAPAASDSPPSAARSREHRKFHPDQLRDPGGEGGGRWVRNPAAGAKDALKLADKIDLAPGETLVGSGKVDADQGGARVALTMLDGKPSWRVGFGGEGFGQRNRDEGIPAWEGNRPREPLPKADRERLAAERDDLALEYDGATPGRQDEIDARLDDIREQLAIEADEGGTARLDEYSMDRLASVIGPAVAEGTEQLNTELAAWDELQDAEAQQKRLRYMSRKWTAAEEAEWDSLPARIDKLRQVARIEPDGRVQSAITFAEGIVPGSEWGDVHYRVELDDPSVGVQVLVGVQPKDAPDNWGDSRDWEGAFTPAEWKKFMRQVEAMRAAAAAATDKTGG